MTSPTPRTWHFEITATTTFTVESDPDGYESPGGQAAALAGVDGHEIWGTSSPTNAYYGLSRMWTASDDGTRGDDWYIYRSSPGSKWMATLGYGERSLSAPTLAELVNKVVRA